VTDSSDTPAAKETARIVHALPGRLRLRLPALRGAADALTTLEALLAAQPGVVSVKSNARTASLLIVHDGDTGSLCARLEAAASLQIQAAAPAPPSARPALPALPARRLLGGALLLAGVVQLWRGEIAVPATTAFWYAWNLLAEQPPLGPLSEGIDAVE